MQNNEPTTFKENPNKKLDDIFKQKIDINEHLNVCRRCGKHAGKKWDNRLMELVGIYLLADARGYKICNLCATDGFHIPVKKLSKSEKKRFKAMKREMQAGKLEKIPHVTVDAKGEVVE